MLFLTRLNPLCICDVLRDLVPFLQFKNMKNTRGGVLPATLLKATLLHECFSRFLNSTNGTKSRYASQYKIVYCV